MIANIRRLVSGGLLELIQQQSPKAFISLWLLFFSFSKKNKTAHIKQFSFSVKTKSSFITIKLIFSHILKTKFHSVLFQTLRIFKA